MTCTSTETKCPPMYLFGQIHFLYHLSCSFHLRDFVVTMDHSLAITYPGMTFVPWSMHMYWTSGNPSWDLIISNAGNTLHTPVSDVIGREDDVYLVEPVHSERVQNSLMPGNKDTHCMDFMHQTVHMDLSLLAWKCQLSPLFGQQMPSLIVIAHRNIQLWLLATKTAMGLHRFSLWSHPADSNRLSQFNVLAAQCILLKHACILYTPFWLANGP